MVPSVHLTLEPNDISIGSAIFSESLQFTMGPILYNGLACLPKSTPSRRASRTLSNTWFLGPTINNTEYCNSIISDTYYLFKQKINAYAVDIYCNITNNIQICIMTSFYGVSTAYLCHSFLIVCLMKCSRKLVCPTGS